MSRSILATALFIAAASSQVWAYSSGPDPRVTGAPGDRTCNSSGCHTGTAVNSSNGNVTISLPGSATYVPGVKQRVTVKISDNSARRWGFQLTARLDSAPSTGQAGSLTSSDSQTQVLCDVTGRKAPCSSASVVQFVEHTTAGTRAGTTGGVTFSFDWTPPATDSGPVTLYTAANGANNNGSESGDHIYTTSIQLTPASAAPSSSISGVVNFPTALPGTSPANWITINGTNLSNTTRTWTAAEAAAGLPTNLDGVTVQVNGKPAYVQSISPTKVVVLTPSDTSTGPVGVVVNNNGTATASFSVTMAQTAPALLVAPDNRYLVTSHGTSPVASRLDNFPATTLPTPTGAVTGETISFYGTGFGATNPAITDGTLQATAAPLVAPVTLTIGGETAPVSFAGLAPGFAGIYQFTTTVPTDLPTADQPVVITLGNQKTQNGNTCCYIQVTNVPPTPTVTGVVSTASLAAGTAPASWITINGANLSSTTRTWTSDEATASTGLPTSLDGVSVQVNNIAAYVQAVSPTQLIVITPSDVTTGQINVQVTNSLGAAAPFSVTMANIAPTLFTADGKYLVTTHGTNPLDTRTDVYPATTAWPTITWPAPTPAAPGETISFYGTGFGATDTPIVDGQLQTATVNITTPFTMTVGGETVTPTFAGLAPGFAGLFQFTVNMPTDLPSSDQPVVITMGGLTTVSTDKCCFVKLQPPTALDPPPSTTDAASRKNR